MYTNDFIMGIHAQHQQFEAQRSVHHAALVRQLRSDRKSPEVLVNAPALDATAPRRRGPGARFIAWFSDRTGGARVSSQCEPVC